MGERARQAGGLLFEREELYPWLAEWEGMPEYVSEDLEPKFQILVSFGCAADVADFARLLGVEISTRPGRQTKSVWFPEAEIGRYANKRYIAR